jgi:hypothetical protein
MKKIFILFLVVVLFTALLKSTVPYMSVTAEVSPCFARVKYNNVLLYKSPTQSSEFENVFCLLEPSYFVEVIKDENQLFFKANYLSLTGFVLKSQVECVTETPQKPYPANVTFSSTNFSSIVLRKEPNVSTNNALTLIPPNSTLLYYRKIEGETVTQGLGSTWYFAQYEALDGQKIDGYVYAALTHNVTPITENVEATTLSEFGLANEVNALLNIKPQFQIVLTVLTTLPLLFVLILFLKQPNKINPTK